MENDTIRHSNASPAFDEAVEESFAHDRAPASPECLSGLAGRMQGQGLPEVGAPENKRARAAQRWAHGVKPTQPGNSGSPLNLVKREHERRAAKNDKENGRG